MEKFVKDRVKKHYHLVIGPDCKIVEISNLLEKAILEKSSKQRNVLITVKSKASEKDRTSISLPNLYEINSDTIDDLRSVKGVFEVKAN